MFTRTAGPDWLLAFWKEIDDKTFGKGFDCLAEDAIGRLGVAQWNGRRSAPASDWLAYQPEADRPITVASDHRHQPRRDRRPRFQPRPTRG